MARGVEPLDQDLPRPQIVTQAVGGELEGVVDLTVLARGAPPGPEAGATAPIARLDDPRLQEGAAPTGQALGVVTDQVARIGLPRRLITRHAEQGSRHLSPRSGIGTGTR